MALDRSSYLDLNQNIRLRQLANTGQVELVYTNNPTDKPGKDRHVVVVRDETGAVLQDNPLSTDEFRALVTGTELRCPAPATLKGKHADYREIRRTGELLYYFDTIAFDLRGTCPSANGRQLDLWDRRQAEFAAKWNALDVTDRRCWLAEARAVLYEHHGTQAEFDRHVVPTLTELHDRELRAPGVITNSVRLPMS